MIPAAWLGRARVTAPGGCPCTVAARAEEAGTDTGPARSGAALMKRCSHEAPLSPSSWVVVGRRRHSPNTVAKLVSSVLTLRLPQFHGHFIYHPATIDFALIWYHCQIIYATHSFKAYSGLCANGETGIAPDCIKSPLATPQTHKHIDPDHAPTTTSSPAPTAHAGRCRRYVTAHSHSDSA